MRNRLAALALCLALAACSNNAAGTRVPADAASSVVSMLGIDCGSCGEEVAEALRSRPGVYEATFDRKLAELNVRYDAAVVEPDVFVQLAKERGHSAVLGAGQGNYLPIPQFDDALDFKIIAEAGEAVQLEAHVVAAKVTVFDFYALWCKPCRELDHHMKGVLKAHPDVALRKLDVVDWDSALAKQYLGDVPNLPYVIIYGVSGKAVAKISGLDLARIDAAIEKARHR